MRLLVRLRAMSSRTVKYSRIGLFSKSIIDRIASNITKKDLGLMFCIIVFIVYLAFNAQLRDTPIVEDSSYDVVRKAQADSPVDPLMEKKWEIKTDLFISPFLKVCDYKCAIFLVMALITLVTLLAIYIAVEKDSLIFFIIGITPFFFRNSLVLSNFTAMPLLITLFLIGIARSRYMLAFLAYLLISYINPAIGIVSLTMIIYLFLKKRIKSYVLALFSLPLIFTFGMTSKSSFIINKSLFETFIFDFGTNKGIPITLIFLAVFSIIYFWKSMPMTKTALLSSVVISFFDLESGLFLINMLSIFLCVRVIDWLMGEKWENKDLKSISMLIIFCSILFSGVSYASIVMDSKDSEEIINGMEWLEDNTQKGDLIFSHYKYGFKLKFFSNTSIFLDEDIGPDRIERFEDMNLLFNSRNSNTTASIIGKYNITNIFITEEMKHGLVWNKESEGLLFVMENDNSFSKVFNNSEVEIWRYGER